MTFKKEKPVMTLTQRILIAVAVLLVDGVLFFLPLSAIFIAYILLINPPWFREFLHRTASPA